MKQVKIHRCEPSLEVLLGIRNRYNLNPNNENSLRKLEALNSQIARHQAALELNKQ